MLHYYFIRNNCLIYFLSSILLSTIVTVRADFVFSEGNLVGHTNVGGLTITNPASTQSLFLTSSQSRGYQAELPTETTKSVLVSTTAPKSFIECQQPFGNPVACASGCTHAPGGSYLWGNTVCNPGVGTFAYSPTAGSDDTLNEQGTHTTDLNHVFLDTIINKSPATFDIAITNAPLYIPIIDEQGNSTPDPKSIAGGLYTGTNSIFDDIYKNRSLTLGGTKYSVTFLTTSDLNPDGRFTVYPATQLYATKRHMANPLLALSGQITTGTQTIILIPHNFTQSNCQPTLFIGRDSNNIFYGLTYVSKNAESGVWCCQDQMGNPCATDSLYTWQLVDGMAAHIPPGAPGRLKITITPDVSSPQVGVLSSIQALPGLWWPGQPDFTL